MDNQALLRAQNNNFNRSVDNTLTCMCKNLSVELLPIAKHNLWSKEPKCWKLSAFGTQVLQLSINTGALHRLHTCIAINATQQCWGLLEGLDIDHSASSCGPQSLGDPWEGLGWSTVVYRDRGTPFMSVVYQKKQVEHLGRHLEQLFCVIMRFMWYRTWHSFK